MPTAPSTPLIQHLSLSASRVPREVYGNFPQWLGKASNARRQGIKNAPLTFADWYANASREQQAPFKQTINAHWVAQNQVDAALAALNTPQQFAAPLLQQALQTRFGVEAEVGTTYLRLYTPLTALFGVPTGGYSTWTVSLVDAALHNFDAAESKSDAYTSESTFITQPSADGRFNTLPAVRNKVSIEQFVKLCRELDLGKHYQGYLTEFFGFKDAVLKAALRNKLITHLKAEAQANVFLAHLKKDVSTSVFSALKNHLKGISGISFDGQPLFSHDLSLMNAPLTGIVLIAPDLEAHAGTVPIAAYIPGDPQAPLKYYANGTAFMRDLADKLRSADYQTFFSRFVNQEHRGYFFADLNSRLTQVTWHQPVPGDPRPVWRDEPVSRPNLQFYATKITGDLYEHLYQSKLNQLLNDARMTAVSTADADRKARWQRWAILQKIGKAILEIAAFIATPFIPPLGALMLGYTAYQLLDETFEGIVDWAQGLKRQAVEHVMSILEQMVQLGMFAVGAPIAEGLLRQALPQAAKDFFETLTPVTTDGKTRLWNPDLSPYAHDIQLPSASRPNREGLHTHADQLILPLRGQHFAVEQQAGNAFLRHPTRTHAYRPSVMGNGNGAWVTPVDRPLTWDRTTLLERVGPAADGLSAARLEQAQTISGTDDASLRKMYMDRQPPPPLLADTLKRVKIDQQLQDFIDQMNSDDPALYKKADPQTQLWLLSQTSLWPESKTLRFLNAKGETVWEHKGRKNAAVAQIHEAQMHKGDLLETLLETLDESERKTLLEEDFGTPSTQLHVRADNLRKRLAERAQEKRAAMFDSRYRGLEITDNTRVQKIINTVPGLPVSAAEEVLNGATDLELLEIDQGRVPQALRDRADWAAHEVRISRAHEGLYMDSLESSDTQRLALHGLQNLPGWSPQVRLEVRDFNRTGSLRDSIGEPAAPIQRILVRTIEGDYIPEDDKDTLFGETDFFTAALRALPDAQRDALNLHIGQGPLLRHTLRQHIPDRETVGQLLAQAPVRKPFYDPNVMRLPGGMQGYDASPPTSGSSSSGPPTLAQQLHDLYPSLSQEAVTQTLNAMSSHPGSPAQTLEYLKNEFRQLESDLSLWAAASPRNTHLTQVPLSHAALFAEQGNRLFWKQQLIRAWRHETNEAPNVPHGLELQLNHPLYGELPTLTANFDHICDLQIKGDLTTRNAPAFLARFPKLNALDISGIPLRTLPAEVFSQPQLTALTLRNCALSLTTESRAQLAALTRLKTLDLSNNPLALAPDLRNMPDLKTLNLHQTNISVFPSGLPRGPQLTSANLSNNYLRRLPNTLFDLPGEVARGYNLSGNPLSRTTLEQIKSYCQKTGEYFAVDANPEAVRLLHELYPTYTVQEANQFIFSMPGGLDDSIPALMGLKADYERLQADLQEWVVDVPTRHPLTKLQLSEQVQAQQQRFRQAIRDSLEEGWRRETSLDLELGPLTTTHELELAVSLLGDLPVLNVDFKHISKLELSTEGHTTIPDGFLEHFPNLESLLIHRYALMDIPKGTFNLPKLKTLILGNNQIRLTPASAARLSDLENLEYLDLSDNPLGISPDVSKMSGLSTLQIQNAGLTEPPAGVFNLSSLELLNLSNNQITELPTDILEIAPDLADGFDLSGNPFSPRTIAMLHRYYNRTAVSFNVVEARLGPPPNPEADTPSASSEEEGEA